MLYGSNACTVQGEETGPSIFLGRDNNGELPGTTSGPDHTSSKHLISFFLNDAVVSRRHSTGVMVNRVVFCELELVANGYIGSLKIS